jgi:hypothetical protein
MLKVQRKNIHQIDLIFLLLADLEVNHAKLEQAFALVNMGYSNVLQTHITVGVEKY